MFVSGARTMALMHQLRLPVILSLQLFPVKMEAALAAFRGGEMGGRDLAVFVEEMAEEKPELWELASMMSEQIKDGASILRQYREDGAESVTNAPKCWTSPLHPTHDVRLEYHEVKSKNIADAITKVSSTAGDVHLAYRLSNRPTYKPMVALLMWQLEDSHTKYWLNCTSMDAEKMELATAILDKIKYVHDYA